MCIKEALLVSKMTRSLSANSAATVFQKVLKSAVDSMILPELEVESVYRRMITSGDLHLLSAVVVGIKNRISTAVGDELHRLYQFALETGNDK